MLVLSRKHNESVVVGGTGGWDDAVKITVLAINGRGVKLGFEADEAVRVYREEVWERIHSAGQRDPPTVGNKAKVLSGGEKRTARARRTQGGTPRTQSGGSMIDDLVRVSTAVVSAVPQC